MDFAPLNISFKNTRLLGAFLRAAGILFAAFILLLGVAFSPTEWAFADEEDEAAATESVEPITAESLDLPGWASEDEDIAGFLTTINEKAQGVKSAESDAAAAEQGLEDARKKVEDLQEQVEEMKATIKKVAGQLADQKQKSADALKLQYMLDASGFNLTDFIFSSTSLNDFVRNLEYMEHVQELNLAEIGRYAEMKAEHEQAKLDLEKKEAEAAEEQRLADARLEDSKAKLEEAKAAQKQAEEELAAEIDARNKALEAAGTIDDNVNWNMSKEDFIKEWGARIDAYLGGAPLGGNGKVFAEAAWDNHIDPRWSPAISCVESSKGAICFLPHNAWGWGQSSWSSWPEAIKAHVAGLAKGYGYSVTLDKAMKYCPPNAQEWYVQCVGEMRKI